MLATLEQSETLSSTKLQISSFQCGGGGDHLALLKAVAAAASVLATAGPELTSCCSSLSSFGDLIATLKQLLPSHKER